MKYRARMQWLETRWLKLKSLHRRQRQVRRVLRHEDDRLCIIIKMAFLVHRRNPGQAGGMFGAIYTHLLGASGGQKVHGVSRFAI